MLHSTVVAELLSMLKDSAEWLSYSSSTGYAVDEVLAVRIDKLEEILRGLDDEQIN